MKWILVILLIPTLSCQQNEESAQFYKAVYNLDNAIDSAEFLIWKKTHLTKVDSGEVISLMVQDSIPLGDLYYENDEYLVFGYCAGEFGGALLFQDKDQPDSLYYLQSTCPVMIDNRDNGFYIVESLAHGSGHSRVRFFDTPRNLDRVHTDSISTNWKNRKYPGLGDHEIWEKFDSQGKVLVDTNRLMFNILFPHKDENYLIYTGYGNTYLGMLTNKGLKTVDTLVNVPSWRYSDSPNHIIDNMINGYYHYNYATHDGYSNDKTIRKTVFSGDIYAKGDSIIIAYKNSDSIESK